jgi:hypothetical protein
VTCPSLIACLDLTEPLDAPAERIAAEIGPRVVGGRYWAGLVGEAYTVLAIHAEPVWPIRWPWHIIVRRHIDGLVIVRCTPWDDRYDRVLDW